MIQYTINDQHVYYIDVKARIEYVKLEFVKSTLKFQFNDNSDKMEISEVL